MFSCCSTSSGAFQVDEQTDVATLRAILEAETGIGADKQLVVHHGKELPARSGVLKGCCIADACRRKADVKLLLPQWDIERRTGPT